MESHKKTAHLLPLSSESTLEDAHSTWTPSQPSEPSEPSNSLYGSIGSESIVVQQIPVPSRIPATCLPSTSQAALPSALLSAVLANSPEECRKVLESTRNGISNYKDEHGRSPLHVASSFGFVKVCEVILDYGHCVDIDCRTVELLTPLHLACLNGHLPVAKLLVRSRAQLNPLCKDNNSPLHLLAKHGSTEFVAWYLSKNPDLSIPNKDGASPWDLAVSVEVKELLQEHSLRTGSGLFSGRATAGKFWAEPSEVGPANFSILQELGRGSFGEVFLVRKCGTAELFAMKVLKKERILKHNLVRYALTERNVLSYMRHPFIMSLNYAFQTPEKLFLVLDFCPGRDLSVHLAREKRFSEEKARKYLCEILLAVEELHRRDIIFRDLKPDNVVLDSEGHARLTDFGLSKEGVYDNVTAKSFCGSLAYLAPEMIKRSGHGKSVDWYLLGVLFYEMLIGVPPYFTPNKEQLLQDIQRGKLKVPTALSAESKDLLKGLLRRDPSLRLGARRDAEEIKEHPFFRGVDWDSVLRRELELPRPEPVTVSSEVIAPEQVFGDFSACVNVNKITGWTFVSNSNSL